jgi:hypothetical protein
MKKQLALCAFGAILLALPAFFLGLRMNFHPENQKPGKFPEQLVYVRSADDVVDGGVLFTSTNSPSKPLAIIWVHGWGVNFYAPSYVGIGRALAERGFPTISVNTRMHDIGNVEKYTLLGKRVRGGGYWGITSEDARDVAAWIDYAQQLGYSRSSWLGIAPAGPVSRDIWPMPRTAASRGWSLPRRASDTRRNQPTRNGLPKRRSAWMKAAVRT